MYYFYILKSKKNKMTYTGSTNDLRRRMHEHNNSESKSTKSYVPWELIYYEAYRSEIDARTREKMLKHHGKGLAELKKRIKNSLGDVSERSA